MGGCQPVLLLTLNLFRLGPRHCLQPVWSMHTPIVMSVAQGMRVCTVVEVWQGRTIWNSSPSRAICQAARGSCYCRQAGPPLLQILQQKMEQQEAGKHVKTGRPYKAPGGRWSNFKKYSVFQVQGDTSPEGLQGLMHGCWPAMTVHVQRRDAARKGQQLAGSSVYWPTALLCWTGIDAITCPAVVLLLACYSRVNSACHWAILSHAAALTLSLVPSEKPHDLELCPGAMLQALLVERQDQLRQEGHDPREGQVSQAEGGCLGQGGPHQAGSHFH